MATVEAARRIGPRHRILIVDDGDRPELSATAAAEGIGYFTRSQDWRSTLPHTAAGRFRGGLMRTDGEFILVLNAGQIPETRILESTLGYFNDPQVAFVQTPHHHDVPFADPLQRQSARLDRVLQQGQDGWNAVTFDGTNAILRREALMHLEVDAYVRAVERDVKRTLAAADTIIRRAKKTAGQGDLVIRTALDGVGLAVDNAWRAVDRGLPLGDITYRFREQVDAASRSLVEADVTTIRADLDAIAALGGGAESVMTAAIVDDAALDALASRDWSPSVHWSPSAQSSARST